MRSRVKIGTKIRIMEFLSQNVALCRIQEKVGTDTLFILGEGMSMTIKENEVIEHDRSVMFIYYFPPSSFFVCLR